ncbi:MAG: HEAT repeat domain-containing protein [bacterium]
MHTRTLIALAAALLPTACGSAPPQVPPVEPAGAECRNPDPPADAPDPAPPPGAGRFLPAPTGQKSLGLAGLRPQDGVHPGAPIGYAQILTLRHPPSEQQWRALPPGSDAQIRATVEDPAEDPLTRVRAMEGLSIRAPEDGDAPLRAILADPATDATLRRGAARALARGYLDAAPATEALIAALADQDATVREAAVHALAPHVARPAVKDALTRRAAVEESEVVREAITAALAE